MVPNKPSENAPERQKNGSKPSSGEVKGWRATALRRIKNILGMKHEPEQKKGKKELTFAYESDGSEVIREEDGIKRPPTAEEWIAIAEWHLHEKEFGDVRLRLVGKTIHVTDAKTDAKIAEMSIPQAMRQYFYAHNLRQIIERCAERARRAEKRARSVELFDGQNVYEVQPSGNDYILVAGSKSRPLTNVDWMVLCDMYLIDETIEGREFSEDNGRIRIVVRGEKQVIVDTCTPKEAMIKYILQSQRK